MARPTFNVHPAVNYVLRRAGLKGRPPMIHPVWAEMGAPVPVGRITSMRTGTPTRIDVFAKRGESAPHAIARVTRHHR